MKEFFSNIPFLPTLAIIPMVAVWIVTTVVLGFVSYLMNRPPSPTRPEPGTFERPTIAPGKTIPVVFGTVMIRDPAIVWWGHRRIEEIIKKG